MLTAIRTGKFNAFTKEGELTLEATHKKYLSVIRKKESRNLA